jgi:hypothetical protein
MLAVDVTEKTRLKIRVKPDYQAERNGGKVGLGVLGVGSTITKSLKKLLDTVKAMIPVNAADLRTLGRLRKFKVREQNANTDKRRAQIRRRGKGVQVEEAAGI